MHVFNENNKSKTKWNERKGEREREEKKFGRKEDGVITIDVEIHLTNENR